jgi:hypothetical protein
VPELSLIVTIKNLKRRSKTIEGSVVRRTFECEVLPGALIEVYEQDGSFTWRLTSVTSSRASKTATPFLRPISFGVSDSGERVAMQLSDDPDYDQHMTYMGDIVLNKVLEECSLDENAECHFEYFGKLNRKELIDLLVSKGFTYEQQLERWA